MYVDILKFMNLFIYKNRVYDYLFVLECKEFV